MNGRRIPDGADWFGFDDTGTERPPGHPGDYGRMMLDGKWEWMVQAPSGFVGCLSGHDVTEHENGTISVSPSILIYSPGGAETNYHGYLERGVWRSV